MKNDVKALKKSRRRTRIALAGSLVLLCLSLTVIFLNWDYISYKAFLSAGYIHTGALDTIYRDNIGMDVEGRYYRYFDNLSISLLSREVREKAEDPYTFQYNPSQQRSYEEWREEKSARSYVEELTPDTVYMLLTNFTRDTFAFFNENLDFISGYNNLVLDLRDNSGGDLDIMLKIGDAFVEKGGVLIIEKTRFRERGIPSRKDPSLSFDKIIILQNGNSASAAELLILALSENLEQVTTIGETTYGKSVGQTVLNLMRGFRARATTLVFLSPGNKLSIHSIGIVPDIVLPPGDLVRYALEEIIQ
ncbi:MAG: S41 family peptidase [Clostridia bacterium]